MSRIKCLSSQPLGVVALKCHHKLFPLHPECHGRILGLARANSCSGTPTLCHLGSFTCTTSDVAASGTTSAVDTCVCGNRSWMVFQSTVFMVQALPLLHQLSKHGQEFIQLSFRQNVKST